MIKLIGKILKKISRFLHLIADTISPKPAHKTPSSVQSVRTKPWFNDNGDKTHRLNYELNENSVVMDLGGYEGQWTADIFCKYACNVHVFEPYKEYAKKIKARFKKNAKVRVYEFGLTKATVTEKLSISADTSSVYKPGETSVTIELAKIDDFLNDHHIDHIELIKINIEGGEYDLLEHLVQSGLIVHFENIQVQFHDFVPGAADRMHAIQNYLSKTHYLTYQYEFVWENWKLKS